MTSGSLGPRGADALRDAAPGRTGARLRAALSEPGGALERGVPPEQAEGGPLLSRSLRRGAGAGRGRCGGAAGSDGPRPSRAGSPGRRAAAGRHRGGDALAGAAAAGAALGGGDPVGERGLDAGRAGRHRRGGTAGRRVGGGLTSARAQADNGQPRHGRQLCWAPLRRACHALIERGGAGAPVGALLVEQAAVRCGWGHRVRAGSWSRAPVPHSARGRRGVFREALDGGTRSGCPHTAAPCRDLLKVAAALWTCVRVPGIAVTTTAAARARRPAGPGRKTRYGTDSVAGSQCVETVLTGVASCRHQERDVLAYLTHCCQALYTGTLPPSLLPQTIG